MADHETKTRLLTKIAWELLKEQSFEDLSEFAAVLKLRLARLKIRWEPHELSDVIARISSHTEILADPYKGLERVKGTEQLDGGMGIPRHDAARLYNELVQRFGPLAKSMPSAKPSKIEIAGEIPSDEVEHDRY